MPLNAVVDPVDAPQNFISWTDAPDPRGNFGRE